MLEIKSIDAYYGETKVLWNISLNVRQGELLAIIGPNGAGKTTIMCTIMGLLAPKRGTILYERKNQEARTLSGGESQMLAIARALMSKPKLLLLDEPSLGLAPNLVTSLFQTIKKLNKHGLTIIIVEQHVSQVLEAADRSYLLENGSIILEDTGSKMLSNPHVKKAYLGL